MLRARINQSRTRARTANGPRFCKFTPEFARGPDNFGQIRQFFKPQLPAFSVLNNRDMHLCDWSPRKYRLLSTTLSQAIHLWQPCERHFGTRLIIVTTASIQKSSVIRLPKADATRLAEPTKALYQLAPHLARSRCVDDT